MLVALIESFITSIQDNIAIAFTVISFFIVIYTLSLAIIFKKIGHKAAIAFIPVYNIMELLSILNIPRWMSLIIFIPFVNIIGFPFMSIIIGYKLGTLCRKNILIKLGLMFLSPIFYPFLAFVNIDINDSTQKEIEKEVSKLEFKLDAVKIDINIELPQAMSLAESETLEKIGVTHDITSNEKIENKITVEAVSEHLSKADKEMPTAHDLTFDYNLIYNSNVSKEVKVEEVVNDTSTLVESEKLQVEEKVEEIIDAADNIPVVPIVHDIVLETADLNSIKDMGPLPINKRYENQLNANKEQLEKQREKELILERQKQAEIIQERESIVILDNGPISLDSSIAGLMASAPDFSQPVKLSLPEEKEDVVIEPRMNENIHTTEVKEIVSMNIVEPSQLPVAITPESEVNTTIEENIEEISEIKNDSQNVLQEKTSSLLRPTVLMTDEKVQIDKLCPQCNTKLRRDCPVCIICGYRF